MIRQGNSAGQPNSLVDDGEFQRSLHDHPSYCDLLLPGGSKRGGRTYGRCPALEYVCRSASWFVAVDEGSLDGPDILLALKDVGRERLSHKAWHDERLLA